MDLNKFLKIMVDKKASDICFKVENFSLLASNQSHLKT